MFVDVASNSNDRGTVRRNTDIEWAFPEQNVIAKWR